MPSSYPSVLCRCRHWISSKHGSKSTSPRRASTRQKIWGRYFHTCVVGKQPSMEAILLRLLLHNSNIIKIVSCLKETEGFFVHVCTASSQPWQASCQVFSSGIMKIVRFFLIEPGWYGGFRVDRYWNDESVNDLASVHACMHASIWEIW